MGDEITIFCEEFVDKNLPVWENDFLNHGTVMIQLDVSEIQSENYEMTEMIIADPNGFLEEMKRTVSPKTEHQFDFTYIHLPKYLTKPINEINHLDENKLFFFEVLLKRTTDMIKLILERTFECPQCGSSIRVLQNENKKKEPYKCSCGRKGGFREIRTRSKILQIGEVEDIQQSEIPKSLTFYLMTDRPEPVLNERLGSKIRIIGWLTDTPFFAQNKHKNENMHDIFFCVNNIEFLEQSYKEIEVNQEDIIKIKEFAQQSADQLLFKLSNCIGQELYGMYPIKKALMLQQFEGTKISKKRNKIHILLCGSPSTGKSTIMRSVTEITPKFRKAVGGKTSSVGIVGGMIREDLTNRWSLERGSITLATEGTFVLDEMEKIDPTVLASLNEAMEEQVCTITKIGVNIRLPANVSVLASANPKLSDFDTSSPFFEQIDLDNTILSRFDLIFIILDKRDDEHIDGVANKIFRKTKQQEEISKEFVKKYISYAKENYNPEWTEETSDLLKKEFKNLLKLSQNLIPMRIRHLEGLKRLAEAHAKMRLSQIVEMIDAQTSIKMFYNYLKGFGVTEEFGIETIPMVKEIKMNKKLRIFEIITHLFQVNKERSHQEIEEALGSAGYSKAQINKEIIPDLCKGDLYEFKNGFYKLI